MNTAGTRLRAAANIVTTLSEAVYRNSASAGFDPVAGYPGTRSLFQ